MSVSVRFKLANPDHKIIMNIINNINRSLPPTEKKFSLESFAKTCIIHQIEDIIKKEAQIRAKLQADSEQQKDAANDTPTSPSEQQQPVVDAGGSIPNGGLAQVSDNGEANG